MGISPIPPKTCNYSCVYCQLGRTTNYTNTRKKFFDPNEIVEEVKEAVEKSSNIDFITIVGDGEPLLYTPLDRIIEGIKDFGIPIAIISNGALLYKEEVREEISSVDLALLKIDAGNEELWKKINRPHPDLKYDEVFPGMIEFSQNFRGKIFLETMLVNNLNTGEGELLKIRELVEKIRHDKFFVSVPTRPPAEKWVRVPPEDKREKAIKILQAIPIFYVETGEIGTSGFKDFKECIIKITRRHPLREDEVIAIGEKFGVNWKEEVENLINIGEIKVEDFFGHKYYVYGGAR